VPASGHPRVVGQRLQPLAEDDHRPARACGGPFHEASGPPNQLLPPSKDGLLCRPTLFADAAGSGARGKKSRMIQVKTPPNSRFAPRGFYMLFALTGDGVPSVAQWVKLE